MDPSKKQHYYYSNNEQVVLEDDDEFMAFDLNVIKRVPKEVKSFVANHAEQLRKSVYLFCRKDLTDEVKELIDEYQAWRPVFRSGDSLLVLLPEIRVHDDSLDDLEKRVEAWVRKHVAVAQMKPDRRGRVVVEPIVKSGVGALEIANSLIEDLKVESAVPRMIQKLRAPKPREN